MVCCTGDRAVSSDTPTSKLATPVVCSRLLGAMAESQWPRMYYGAPEQTPLQSDVNLTKYSYTSAEQIFGPWICRFRGWGAQWPRNNNRSRACSRCRESALALNSTRPSRIPSRLSCRGNCGHRIEPQRSRLILIGLSQGSPHAWQGPEQALAMEPECECGALYVARQKQPDGPSPGTPPPGS